MEPATAARLNAWFSASFCIQTACNIANSAEAAWHRQMLGGSSTHRISICIDEGDWCIIDQERPYVWWLQEVRKGQSYRNQDTPTISTPLAFPAERDCRRTWRLVWCYSKCFLTNLLVSKWFWAAPKDGAIVLAREYEFPVQIFQSPARRARRIVQVRPLTRDVHDWRAICILQVWFGCALKHRGRRWGQPCMV